MEARRRFLDWVSSTSGGTPVWMCTVEATPRLGTENYRQYLSATIQCFSRAQNESAARESARIIVNEQGWEPGAIVECRSVNRWTVPVTLTKQYRTAKSMGEAYVEFPRARQAAS
jgi:hypothetical protein